MAGKNKTAMETAVETKQGEPSVGAADSGQEADVEKNSSMDASGAERVMYVGPTVPGIGIQNRVYMEVPADAKDIIKKEPQIGNLFIHIRDYPTANRMIREKKGYIYSAFLRAEEIMVENAESKISKDVEGTEERG